VHCFSGTLDDAEKLCSMGFFLGFDGPITYPSADKQRSVVKNIPLSHLLLETDCPYLAPQKYRGQRNEPAYIPLIAEEIALLKRIAVAEVQTSDYG